MEVVVLVILAINYLVLSYFAILNTAYLAMSILAFRALRSHRSRMRSVDINQLASVASAPPITLIAPAYNEEETSVESARSILALEYPNYQVLLVNDGSTDNTLGRLQEAFDLRPTVRYPTAELETAAVRDVYMSTIHPNLWVIDKENGGKADGLNAGLNYCRTPLFCAVDADTLLEKDALLRVARPFMEDATTIASGGIIRIMNGCRIEAGMVTEVRMPYPLLAQLQVLEYLRAFLFGRVAWDKLNVLLIISGAFGLFRRSLAVEIGGFNKDTIGEDMELVVHLHRHCHENGIPYRVTFIPDPVAWTECPVTASVLSRQRDRWQRGLAQSLNMHRRMLFNRRYGRIGMAAFPYFYYLEMYGPVIEFFGYAAIIVSGLLGLLSPLFLITFFILAVMLNTTLSLAAIALEEYSFHRYTHFRDLLRLLALSFVESLGYRQLVAFWRMKGMLSYARNVGRW